MAVVLYVSSTNWRHFSDQTPSIENNDSEKEFRRLLNFLLTAINKFQVPINFKRLIGLKITSVKFTYLSRDGLDVSFSVPLGSLRSDKGDVHENIAEK